MSFICYEADTTSKQNPSGESLVFPLDWEAARLALVIGSKVFIADDHLLDAVGALDAVGLALDAVGHGVLHVFSLDE